MSFAYLKGNIWDEYLDFDDDDKLIILKDAKVDGTVSCENLIAENDISGILVNAQNVKCDDIVVENDISGTRLFTTLVNATDVKCDDIVV
jgi:hypothetical protein